MAEARKVRPLAVSWTVPSPNDLRVVRESRATHPAAALNPAGPGHLRLAGHEFECHSDNATSTARSGRRQTTGWRPGYGDATGRSAKSPPARDKAETPRRQ